MKILKDLRKNINKMQITLKRNQKPQSGQEKLENLFAETKAELKVMDNRLNNTEKQITDLEDRIW